MKYKKIEKYLKIKTNFTLKSSKLKSKTEMSLSASRNSIHNARGNIRNSCNNVRNNVHAVEPIPFCKVCRDAGKSEKEYTSHYVKTRDGDVCCPTLLNQECRYCHQAGHTTKFCPTLKQKEQEVQEEKDSKEFKRNMKVANEFIEETNAALKKSRFAVLEMPDSDEEKEIRAEKKALALPQLVGSVLVSELKKEELLQMFKESFPSLTGMSDKKPKNVTEDGKMSYSEMLSTMLATVQEPKPTNKGWNNSMKVISNKVYPITREAEEKKAKTNIKKKSWADDDSSSDEEDDRDNRYLNRSKCGFSVSTENIVRHLEKAPRQFYRDETKEEDLMEQMIDAHIGTDDGDFYYGNR